MQRHCSDVKITAAPTLTRRQFKGAEEVRGKDGRLKCWWPKGWSWAPDQERMAEDLAR